MTRQYFKSTKKIDIKGSEKNTGEGRFRLVTFELFGIGQKSDEWPYKEPGLHKSRFLGNLKLSEQITWSDGKHSTKAACLFNILDKHSIAH